jgi:predicted kinase
VNCEIRIPDPSLVLLIGSSGAGKSTFAARHFRPIEIVSSDRCRAMICDDENDQSVNREAFSLLHYIARLRLSSGRLVVIDATNLQYRARRPLLRIARAHQTPLVALVFNLPLEKCLANNLARPDRFVIEDIIREHADELPHAIRHLDREGYEKIYILDELDVRAARVEKVKISAEIN